MAPVVCGSPVRWLALLAVFSGCTAAVRTVAPAPQAGMVSWDAGSDSLEAQIATHLERRELVVQREKEGEREVVVLAYRGQRVPDFLVLVRTNRMSPNFSQPKDRRYMLVVQLRTLVSVAPEREEMVLDGLNAFNSEWAYGAFYLERPSNEIAGVWPIRLASGHVFALDTVYDAIVSLVDNWMQLYPVVVPTESERESAPEPDSEPGDSSPTPAQVETVSRAVVGR